MRCERGKGLTSDRLYVSYNSLLYFLILLSNIYYSNSFGNAISSKKSIRSFQSVLRLPMSSKQESSSDLSSESMDSTWCAKHVFKGVMATALCSLSLFTFVSPTLATAPNANMIYTTLSSTTTSSNSLVVSSFFSPSSPSYLLSRPASSLLDLFASATIKTTTTSNTKKVINNVYERSRQKRTLAIKEMESKGIIKVETDDSGNQFLSLPWIPNRRVPYKSLSLQQRLQNEVCAGAFGEFCKDLLLHPVDTLKTRRQAAKKKQLADGSGGSVDDAIPKDNIIANSYAKSQPISTPGGLNTILNTMNSGNNNNNNNNNNNQGISFAVSAPNISPPLIEAATINIQTLLTNFKELYSGFPVVLCASIPQGGAFFLLKKTALEFLAPGVMRPDFLVSILSSSLGTMGYWSFRTPAEIVKTQVQTGQCKSVIESLDALKKDNNGNLKVLWKYYPVMLTLDIPFQVLNFILYGLASDAVLQAGFEPSTWTRLFCGVICGMFCAGVTCPIDVCKTRIIARDKENIQKMKLFLGSKAVNTTLITEAMNSASNSNDNNNMNNDIDGDMNENDNDSDNRIMMTSDTSEDEAKVLERIKLRNKKAGEISVVNTAVASYITASTANSSSGSESSADYSVRNTDGAAILCNTTTNSTINNNHNNNNNNSTVGIFYSSSSAAFSTISGDPNLPFKLPPVLNTNANVWKEMQKIVSEEGFATLFLGLRPRLIYTGLANGIRLAAYGTSRMDLMMRSLDDL